MASKASSIPQNRLQELLEERDLLSKKLVEVLERISEFPKQEPEFIKERDESISQGSNSKS